MEFVFNKNFGFFSSRFAACRLKEEPAGFSAFEIAAVEGDLDRLLLGYPSLDRELARDLRDDACSQIAWIDMSVRAIDAHRATIMERLGIRNLPGLVRYAIRHGLVSADE